MVVLASFCHPVSCQNRVFGASQSLPTACCSTKILNVGLLLFRGLTVVLLFMFNMNNSRGLPTFYCSTCGACALGPMRWCGLPQMRISPNLIQNLPARAARKKFREICLYVWSSSRPSRPATSGHTHEVPAATQHDAEWACAQSPGSTQTDYGRRMRMQRGVLCRLRVAAVESAGVCLTERFITQTWPNIGARARFAPMHRGRSPWRGEKFPRNLPA